jgi:hypothetical protein
VNLHTKLPHTKAHQALRFNHRIKFKRRLSRMLGSGLRPLQREPDPSHCSSEKKQRGMTGKELRKERKRALKIRLQARKA